MIKGDVIFCATAVTNGDLVKGIVDKEIVLRLQHLLYTKILI